MWKEIIKSEAWKNSLLTENPEIQTNDSEFYTTNADTGIAEDRFTANIDMGALFEKRFNSLVSRAYFKIISEAENADTRLKAEFDRWNIMQQDKGLKKDHAFKKKYETVMRRYKAHKKMLEGLKSWNIFSDFRSNDLDFFKAENRIEIHRMYQNGSTEDNMISFLVYRLADLYHYED
ncbi:MAG: hypothetical protein WBM77_00660 [Maribacter sp.]